MAKSSIHIQPVKSNSESHNLRKTELDYVNTELTPTNYTYSDKSIAESRKELEDIYKEKIGQKMQPNATPIREGVFLIKKEHTNEQILNVVKESHKEFGIKPIQIHIHRDEGHFDKENNWKPNLHAHVVYEWNDRETGKSIKLNKEDMSRMQDFFAKGLEMERGKSSSKKHLSALEWKNERIKEVNKHLVGKMKSNLKTDALNTVLANNPKLKKVLVAEINKVLVKPVSIIKKGLSRGMGL
jgi:hypothetical protein